VFFDWQTLPHFGPVVYYFFLTTVAASEKQIEPGVGIDQNLHRSSPLSSYVNGPSPALVRPEDTDQNLPPMTLD